MSFSSEAFPGAKVTSEQIEGGLRFDVAWPNGGSARIDLYPDYAYWQGLFVRGLGIHPEVGNTVAKALKAKGLRYMEMSSSAEPEALEAILKHGHWEPHQVQFAPGRFTPGYRWTF